MNKDICEITCVDEKKVNQSLMKLTTVDTASISKIFKILSDENRLKIILSLTYEGELCVCDLATIINASVATTSHHLQMLKKIEVVATRREGKLVYYYIVDKRISPLISTVIDLKRGV